jgi:hypothetical protein
MHAVDWKVHHRESDGVRASEQPEENLICRLFDKACGCKGSNFMCLCSFFHRCPALVWY